MPLGEVDEGDTTYLLRSQGQFQDLDQIRDLVVLTKKACPVYLRDIADVRDTTEDLRSFQRINGKPGVQMRSRSSLARTRSRSPPPSATRSRAPTSRCRACT